MVLQRPFILSIFFELYFFTTRFAFLGGFLFSTTFSWILKAREPAGFIKTSGSELSTGVDQGAFITEIFAIQMDLVRIQHLYLIMNSTALWELM